MRSFSFRLDSILDYREYLEKKAKKALFSARDEYMRRKMTVKTLGGERMEAARNWRDEVYKGVDVSRYQIFRSYLKKLGHDLEKAHARVKEGGEMLREKEMILRKESIRKKTLETLKELERQKYMNQLQREEQKVMDELAVMRQRRER